MKKIVDFEGIKNMMKLVIKVKQNMTHETLKVLLTDQTLEELNKIWIEIQGREEDEYKMIILINQFFSLIGTDNILTQLNGFIIRLGTLYAQIPGAV